MTPRNPPGLTHHLIRTHTSTSTILVSSSYLISFANAASLQHTTLNFQPQYSLSSKFSRKSRLARGFLVLTLRATTKLALTPNGAFYTYTFVPLTRNGVCYHLKSRCLAGLSTARRPFIPVSRTRPLKSRRFVDSAVRVYFRCSYVVYRSVIRT